MRRGAFSIILCIVMLGGLAHVPRAMAATPDCRGGLSASALNDMIRGSMRGPGGIAGMDYAHVHTLPDGRVLWLFQDAFLGNVSNLNNARFVHNAGLIQFGSCLKVLYSGSSSSARSWIGSSSETLKKRWFWPLDGVMGADGRFQQFMVEMRNSNGTGASTGATPVRVWIASIRLSDLKVMSFVPAPDDRDRPLYGFSITSDDSWTYLYGNCYRQFTQDRPVFHHDETCGPSMYVARVPKGKVFNQPTYWSGADWVGGRSDAQAVMERGSLANPMQVRYLDGVFVSVAKMDDWWGDRVWVDTAPSAQGPWNSVATFTVDVLCGVCNTYFAYILPWHDADGSMVVAISNNSWDFPAARDNPRLYRPRLISVRVPDGVHLPDSPPDCAVTRTLRRGMKSAEVTCLRRRLAQLGKPVDPNGSSFDEVVQAAVREVQSAAGLGADGIVGPATGKVLGIRGGRTVTPAGFGGSSSSSCAVTTTLRLGSSGSQVTCLNRRLTALGYGISGSQSTFGTSTKNAVRSFQSSKGLGVDGVVGPATRRALGF